MSVYVDMLGTEPLGYAGRARTHHLWCHMIADTLGELHVMADRLGLQRAWFQNDHYDLVPTRRKQAIRLGAKSCGRHEFMEALRRFRATVAGR